jgi:hypothetical protein
VSATIYLRNIAALGILSGVSIGNNLGDAVSPNTDGPGGTDQFRASEQPAATLGNSGPQDGRTEWPELLGMDCTVRSLTLDA